MKRKLFSLGVEYRTILALGIAGLLIGAAVGTVAALFGHVLNFCTGVRTEWFRPAIYFLPAAGALIVWLYRTVGRPAARGMNLVFQVGLGEEQKLPIRMVPLAMACTWITHLFGGSAGREGVAIQIGAAVSSNVETVMDRWWKLPDVRQVFLITGMAAGFAGLFRTPLTAIFFALEVLVAGELKYHALFSSAVAAFTASMLSGVMGLGRFQHTVIFTESASIPLLLKLAGIGILFGLAGTLFSEGLRRARKLLERLFEGHPYRRVVVMGCVLAVLMILLWQGRYSGTGENLVEAYFGGGAVYWYDWILKGVMTVLTLAAGFVGGEVAPLYAIGTCLGAVLAPVFGLPVLFGQALGYAAVFGSGTNTLIAAIFVGAEVFGFRLLPYFAVTCIVAYIFNLNRSIFGAQKKDMEEYIHELWQREKDRGE
jgi:H+/Cl- antiporter ClcA